LNTPFFRGARDGVPICLGYVSVAFVFGMMCVESGLSPFAAALISMTNLTSAGQFAGLSLLLAGAPLFEIGVTTLVINLRYTLMSLSLSQKVDPRMTTLQRAILSFGNTDEVFAVCMQQKGAVTAPYLAGLVLCVYVGWAAGTVLGATVAGALPDMVRSALGLAIYGMFLAIIVPPARKIRPVLFAVLLSAAISSLFYYTPGLKEISRGWVIILCAVGVSALMAWKFPVPTEVRSEPAPDPEGREAQP
jgi:predicted branched-subunit amino acid permease